MTGKAKAPKFTPFPEPKGPDDTPLVVQAGPEYACSGCGGTIPAGSVLRETVVDGMVTGLVAQHGYDGPEVHSCGKAYPADLPTRAFDVKSAGW